jgi:hypothetical protein
MIDKNIKYVICIRSYYERDFIRGKIYKVETEVFYKHCYAKIYDERNDFLFFDINSIFNEIIMPTYFEVYPIRKIRKDKIRKLNILCQNQH